VYPVRSCLPARDIVYHLHRRPGITADPHLYLAGVFVLHAAQAPDATMRPWTAVFIWNDYTPTLDLNTLRPLAGNGQLRLLGPTRNHVINAIGYLQFIRLGQIKPRTAVKATKRSPTSNSNRTSTSAESRSQPQRLKNQVLPVKLRQLFPYMGVGHMHACMRTPMRQTEPMVET
jgi:hypothetical protein